MRAESIVPLDWGTMVPLWFLGHGRNLAGYGNVLAPDPAEDLGPPVVIATPSRLLPRTAMVEFGEAVADAAEQDRRCVAFASCDWPHTQKEAATAFIPLPWRSMPPSSPSSALTTRDAWSTSTSSS